MSGQNLPKIKIVMVGPSGTGAKTSLLLQYVGSETPNSAAGMQIASYYSKTVNIDGTDVELELWGL